jgi:AcrR family transcriptional regulator
MARTRAQTRLHDAALRIFAERGSTEVSVSDLAQEAGMARGTVYNNLGTTGELFEEIAANLVDEMHRRTMASYAHVDDPARRLAIGIRLFVQRAHSEPDWGRFILRFAYSSKTLQRMWTGAPAADLEAGLEAGRYSIDASKAETVLATITGACLSAMFLVLEGHRTWRDAGSDAAEFLLRGLGLPAPAAAEIATSELPLLAK